MNHLQPLIRISAAGIPEKILLFVARFPVNQLLTRISAAGIPKTLPLYTACLRVQMHSTRISGIGIPETSPICLLCFQERMHSTRISQNGVSKLSQKSLWDLTLALKTGRCQGHTGVHPVRSHWQKTILPLSVLMQPLVILDMLITLNSKQWKTIYCEPGGMRMQI